MIFLKAYRNITNQIKKDMLRTPIIQSVEAVEKPLSGRREKNYRA